MSPQGPVELINSGGGHWESSSFEIIDEVDFLLFEQLLKFRKVRNSLVLSGFFEKSTPYPCTDLVGGDGP